MSGVFLTQNLNTCSRLFSFSEWSSHIWVIKRLFQNENIKGPTSLVTKFCSGSTFSLWWQRLHQQVSVGPAFNWTRSNPWRLHRGSDLVLKRQGLETPLLWSCLVVSGTTSFRVEPSRTVNVPWIMFWFGPGEFVVTLLASFMSSSYSPVGPVGLESHCHWCEGCFSSALFIITRW